MAPAAKTSAQQKKNTEKYSIHEGRQGDNSLTTREIVLLLLGLLTFLLAIFLFLSFISHLFTWGNDQSLRWGNLLHPFTLEASNFMGPIGASLAAVFMSRGVGITAFGFVYITLLCSLRLFRIPTHGYMRKVALTLAGMLLGSTLLAFFTGFSRGYLGFGLGGRMGFYVVQWLNHSISLVGTLFLLIFLTVSYLIWLNHGVATYLFRTLPLRVKTAIQQAREARALRKAAASKVQESASTDDTQATAAEAEAESNIEEEEEPQWAARAEEVNDTTSQPEQQEDEASEPTNAASNSSEEPSAADIPEESAVQSPANAFTPASTPTPVLSQNVPLPKADDAPEEGSTTVEESTNQVGSATASQEAATPPAQASVAEAKEEGKSGGMNNTSRTALESITRNTTKTLESDSENIVPYDPLEDPKGYNFPKSEYLADHGAESIKVTDEELNRNKDRIIDTLLNYKITIERIRATVGPTVTLYEIIPSPGIRISKIKNLEDDIALSLSALGIRIIAPMPGMGTIGIEVPNETPSVVSMLSVVRSEKFRKSTYALPVGLGKTISNDVYMLDLAKAPHLLVAGATGQGKSVGLNAIITSLLYKKRPSELKFLLVDPKKVELTLYRSIASHYLLTLSNGEPGIVTENEQVIDALLSLCKEMDNRYLLLKEANVRHIREYNKLVLSGELTGKPVQSTANGGIPGQELHHHYLPYIVVVIDEYADLIMTAGKDVELPLTRLAQLARAIGIHLVIATQRPLASIITGLIKANFPARIAFRVLSANDSRTILESSGANQLVGRGDMLISLGGETVRVQCAFVDTPEIDRICTHISEEPQPKSAVILPEPDQDGKKDGKGDSSRRPVEVDEEFYDCARYVVSQQRCSASSLQTNFSIGYSKAARVVSHLEYYGIVGEQPANSQKTRDVLIGDLDTLERLLDSIREQQ